MGFIKLLVMGFIGLSVVYLSVSLYARSVCKERLENDFDADHPDGGPSDARDAFVASGMQAYQQSLRRKLIGLVYVVPTITVMTIIYIVNAS